MEEEELKYQLSALDGKRIRYRENFTTSGVKVAGKFDFKRVDYWIDEPKPERITVGGKTYELREVQP